MFYNFFQFLFIVVPVLINVAFFTLLERKGLALAQIRKGPNKISFLGWLQPISDALKLFTKEIIMPLNSSYLVYLLSPGMMLIFILWGWALIPENTMGMDYNFSVIMILLILGISLYPVFMMGWSSNSTYSFLGALRAIAQSVSYEVTLVILLISLVYTSEGLSLMQVMISFKMLVSFIPLFFFWWFCCLAESSRTPFDFTEGESELVSGFNTEYAGGLFALIFMAEYASILFLSCLMVTLIFSMNSTLLTGALVSLLLSLSWVWTRATLPRYRYDKLMNLAWKSVLPMSLALLIYFVSMGFN